MSQQHESQVVITLPDGSSRSYEAGVTVEAVAFDIGPGLGAACIAGVVGDELVAKEHAIVADADVTIVTEDSPEYRRVLRHSASHVLAQAVTRLYPDAKLAIGPPTDDGFYYDFDDLAVDSDALDEIAAEMADIVEADYDVEREDVTYTEARERLQGEPYKLELVEDLEAAGEPVSFYRQGAFVDLCAGPHVDSTGDVEAFEVLETAAAYWRGDETNPMLTRIYGTAFESESSLDEFLDRREKAKRRDHRRLGRELDLYSIPEITGPGLPLYHPNGKTVLRELESFIESLNLDAGYDYVETPHVFRTELWRKSGHYENYRDDMFLFDVDDREFGLKPMNCPGHATIFDQRKWSYRDLPIRYAENGKVYRKEQHGELSGLSRVWAFTIDDGHLFLRSDQIEAEVGTIMEMIEEILETVELDYEIQLATRPEKSVGSDEIWEEAESQLRAVLETRGVEYSLEEGDGAFYGPKIDFAFEDALGRRWDGPTVQLDFNMPERFELSYVGEDNEEHRPVMIHRALYGSYERFFMVLIEHFGGDFPLWLSPEQLRVLPLSDDYLEYAREVASVLEDFRVTVDDQDATLQRKIRQAHDDRVPYQVIVGGNEESAGTISVRDRFEEQAGDVDLESFRDQLNDERAERRPRPDFLQ